MRELLLKCAIFRAGNEVLVVCDTDDTFIEIVRRQKEFIRTLVSPRETWERITLKSNLGEKKTTFYPKSPPPQCRQKNGTPAEKYPELNPTDRSE